MSDLILHHYAGSPFSEKIRLILGYKQLGWRSVNVPVIMPKPDVLALTGGYRKTPFLQIGADIYCDTALMARVIESHAPTPTIYPADAAGAAEILAQWADTTLFWAAIPYAMQPAGVGALLGNPAPEVLKAFAADRAAMNPHRRRSSVADLTAQLQRYLGWLEQQLADGREFLLPGAASIADFSVAQSPWFIRRAAPVAGVLDACPRLLAWYERVAAFGHGRHDKLAAADAIAIAAEHGQQGLYAPTAVQAGLGFDAGAPISVCANDYACDPVAGRLVGLGVDEVVLEREDPRAGVVRVHFPRIGFELKAAA